jgi:hypothetical protein
MPLPIELAHFAGKAIFLQARLFSTGQLGSKAVSAAR